MKEGMDIPRLDRLHLVWPFKRKLSLAQQVGRVMRHHPAKTEVVVFDYADVKQSVFRKHHYERRNYYSEKGYDVYVKETK
jgi:superfamily II DNA or RNA helicase